MLSRVAWLLLAPALLPGGLRADTPRDRPAVQADDNARESDAQEEARRQLESPPPPSGQGTRVLTLAEKKCRERQGCTNPVAPCRPCDR
jgi:hypothetical protein